MSLQLLNTNRTDKNSAHSYLPLYDELLKTKKENAENVLEVGIYGGGSIELWGKYFTNATVYGVDIEKYKDEWNILKKYSNVELLYNIDAYSKETIKKIEHLKFDMVLDDGSHYLKDMIKFINLYLPLLKDDGILIIEDVQKIEWLDVLIENTPMDLKKYIKTYDLRKNKDRYDDIVFTIQRSF